jgi:ATP synthase F1 complex assembly factor 2
VQLQKEHWDPILAWTVKYFKLPSIRTFDDFFDIKQDEKVLQTLYKHIASYDAWDLAALERIVRSSKSFLIGIRLLESIKAGKEAEFGVTEACEAAEVEVKSQTERWGEVEDTHDVDHADLRKTLASVACTVVRDGSEMAKQVASVTIEK